MDFSAVANVLRLYPEHFQPRQIDLPPAGGGFSGALVFRIESPAGDFCLKGWPPESADLQRIRGLHRLLSHFNSQGIDFVAVPVASRSGGTAVFCEGRWWQLEPWMPGRADFHEHSNGDRLNSAMNALARLHRAAATFEPADDEKKWFGSHSATSAPAVENRIDAVATWSADQLAEVRRRIRNVPNSEQQLAHVAKRILDHFERSRAAVEHELRTARLLLVPIQPCLRDVWHDHIFFVGDRATAIIDPSAARSDTVAADLSRLLGSLIGDDRQMWQAAIQAYERVRPLSSAERALVPILDRNGVLLSGMTWIRRRFVKDIRFNEPQRVLERLKRIADRLEFLDHSI